ncbi:hypothetical protein [Streptomyces liliifuscus]|uniref:Uncharacterized protein n=1 Tax=Streptomyces liliifuscus TaxID=2797636 RepID=A0A7T7L288_9ACTN|nr:hypothetical protein [Streptomyces liliifuscus]QQM45125.1 hypothetical protein JEQ17_40835 [Streptomyces liliifuscus]
MRKQGDLGDYLRSVIASTPPPAKPKPAPLVAAPDPGYRIAHAGGWPIGTAATGPTPTHGRCTCQLCAQAAVVQLPQPHQHQEGEAA